MKLLIIVGASLIVILFALPAVFPGRVPPAKITRQRMAYDRVRILEYGRVHGKLPPDLSVLPRLPLKPEADHYFEDGWRRRLVYEVDSSGIVALKSLGRDGLPGGTGEDAGIVFRFPSHGADGNWIEANYADYDSYQPINP